MLYRLYFLPYFNFYIAIYVKSELWNLNFQFLLSGQQWNQTKCLQQQQKGKSSGI